MVRCTLTSDLPGSSAIEHFSRLFPVCCLQLLFFLSFSKSLFSASVSSRPDPAPHPRPWALSPAPQPSTRRRPSPPPASCRSCSRCAPTASGTSSASFSTPTPRECPAPGGPTPGLGPAPRFPAPGPAPRRPLSGPGGLRVTAGVAAGSHSCWSASTVWWRRATCLTRRGPAWARSWRCCASTWRPSAPARTPGTAPQPDLQVRPGAGRGSAGFEAGLRRFLPQAPRPHPCPVLTKRPLPVTVAQPQWELLGAQLGGPLGHSGPGWGRPSAPSVCLSSVLLLSGLGGQGQAGAAALPDAEPVAA